MLQTFKNRVKYAAAIPLIAAGQAMAALPTEVSDAIAAAKADAVMISTAFFIIVMGIAVFLLLRRAAK